MLLCGVDYLQKNLWNYLVSKGSKKSTPSKKVLIREAPLNPYCACLTGKYILDVSHFQVFRIYFWTTNDKTSKNMGIKDTIEQTKARIFNWPNELKDVVIRAMNHYFNFVGLTTIIVNNYSEADYVCILSSRVPFVSASTAPNSLYLAPEYVDNRLIFFLSGDLITTQNILDGGKLFQTILHEIGHGFGLSHPHDKNYDSIIMPGLIPEQPCNYSGIGGFLQNSLFNTVMSCNTQDFFLPSSRDYETNTVGYASTLLPLDFMALRWMYQVSYLDNDYGQKYGVKMINPDANENNITKTIMGYCREITFGKKTNHINFYFIDQNFSFNNLNPIKYELNRVIEKSYSFFPRDLEATISVLNLDNTGTANIFIEKDSLKIDLTINVGCKNCYIYVMENEEDYMIGERTYKNSRTSRSFYVVYKNRSANIKVVFSIA